MRGARVLSLVLLAGCLAPAPSDDTRLAGELALSEPVAALGMRTRETDIVRSDSGALFVAGYASRALAGTPVGFGVSDARTTQAPPVLWRSDDNGASWTLVDPGEGASGNSDIDLAYRDGVLYFASMTFLYAGARIAIGASEDDGRTWRWTTLAQQPLVDRPWVVASPDGSAHVVWNDGVGVHHARSTDKGATWTQTGRVAERGGTGQLAVAPDGTLAARIIPVSGSGYTRHEGETDGVAISTDGGDSWEFRPVTGERAYFNVFEGEQGQTFRWADPLAFDPAGTLYTAWPDEETIVLGWSRDVGASWETSVPVASPGALPHFPALFANASGELAMTWYDLGDNVTARVAHVTGADTPEPRLRSAAFVPVGGRTGGEYFGALFLPDGRIGLTTTVHGPAADDADKGFEYRTAR